MSAQVETSSQADTHGIIGQSEPICRIRWMIEAIADRMWVDHEFAGLGFYKRAPRRIHIDVIHPDGRPHRRWSK